MGGNMVDPKLPAGDEINKLASDSLDKDALEVYGDTSVERVIGSHLGNSLGIETAIQVMVSLAAIRVTQKVPELAQGAQFNVHPIRTNNGSLLIKSLKPEQIDAMKIAEVEPVQIVELGSGPGNLMFGTPEPEGSKTNFIPLIAGRLPIGMYRYNGIELHKGFNAIAQKRWEIYKHIFDKAYGPEAAPQFYPNLINASYKDTENEQVKPLTHSADLVLGVGTAQAHTNLKDYFESYTHFAKPGGWVMIYTFLNRAPTPNLTHESITTDALRLEGAHDDLAKLLGIDRQAYWRTFVMKNDPKTFAWGLMRTKFGQYDESHWSPKSSEVLAFTTLLQRYYTERDMYDPKLSIQFQNALQAYCTFPLKTKFAAAAFVSFRVPEDRAVIPQLLTQAMEAA